MTKRSRKLHKPSVQNPASIDAASTPTEPGTPPTATGTAAQHFSPDLPEEIALTGAVFTDVAQGPDSAKPPHAFQSIALSDANDGPMMRLLRSNQFQQMQMQFDEKPDEKYRQMLTQQGWKWRGEEKVWSKQLDKDNRWRVHADAEKLFNEIGSAIRADKGLSAILEYGG